MAKIDVNTIYQELYQEMRRYRDYELTSSTWYTAFLIAILGFLITVMYGNNEYSKIRDLLVSSFSFQLFVSIPITFLGCASVYSIRYVNLRYREVSDYLFKNSKTKKLFTPKWHKFPYIDRVIRPVGLIYIVHFSILTILNAIIFSSNGIYAISVVTIVLTILFLITIFLLPKITKRNPTVSE